MNLRERFEQRCGTLEDEQYQHVLTLALDDQKQYVQLDSQELDALLDPVRFPPSNSDSERLDEIRERLLESMEIVHKLLQRIGCQDRQ